jgi:hypothetical protein
MTERDDITTATSDAEYDAITERLCADGWTFLYHGETFECFRRDDETVRVYLP